LESYNGPIENGSRKRHFPESTDSQDSSDVSITPERVRMKKNVGLISGTSLIVGTIIGKKKKNKNKKQKKKTKNLF
jgi:hypothetical protein